ncbi:MAG: hypothetical protein OXF49_03455 [Candidatus Saccharibacteria bacterium]|nr:hypothetical protein [Candidatus Saccharibacteria bacterium]
MEQQHYGCDLETEFMESIIDEIQLQKVNVLFAAHHGRKSGKIPKKWLNQLDPDIIVIGEGSSEDLYNYPDYNTITQNSAGDIVFYFSARVVDVFVGNQNYEVGFLENNQCKNKPDEYYIGSLNLT